MKKHVLICLPSYDGNRVNTLALLRANRNPPPDTTINLFETSMSVLAYNFNSLWCIALNMREEPHKVTHFLLMHADVVPEGKTWLTDMMAEMDRVNADVLSAVIPIKNDRGMTSTGEQIPGNDWEVKRYTQTQVNAVPRGSWTTPGILLNTGLMLVDFRKPWVEKICFTMHDRIIRDKDGYYAAQFIPEDWDFTRQCRALGASVYATNVVTVNHVGRANYKSNEVWGFATEEEYQDSLNKE